MHTFQRSLKKLLLMKSGVKTSFQRQWSMNELSVADLFASLSARRTPAGWFSRKENLPNCRNCNHQITLGSQDDCRDLFNGARWLCLLSCESYPEKKIFGTIKKSSTTNTF